MKSAYVLKKNVPTICRLEGFFDNDKKKYLLKVGKFGMTKIVPCQRDQRLHNI